MKYDSYLDNIEHNISFYVYIRNCFEDMNQTAVKTKFVCISKLFSSKYEPKAMQNQRKLQNTIILELTV